MPNSRHVPKLTPCILSPHHWSQEARDNSPNKDGTHCIAMANVWIIIWQQGTYKTTLPLEPFNDTARFYSASVVISDYEGEDKRLQNQRVDITNKRLPNEDKAINIVEKEN
eukprot:9843311-Ditylum_brightwellii.AAC.1